MLQYRDEVLFRLPESDRNIGLVVIPDRLIVGIVLLKTSEIQQSCHVGGTLSQATFNGSILEGWLKHSVYLALHIIRDVESITQHAIIHAWQPNFLMSFSPLDVKRNDSACSAAMKAERRNVANNKRRVETIVLLGGIGLWNWWGISLKEYINTDVNKKLKKCK